MFKCEYSRRFLGIPIAYWKESDKKIWYAMAAARRAKEALLRCPTCGNESLKAAESGVPGLGTSTHVTLACKTKGCEFEDRTIKRSLPGPGREYVRRGSLTLVVGGGLLLVGKATGLFQGSGGASTASSPVAITTASSALPSPPAPKVEGTPPAPAVHDPLAAARTAGALLESGLAATPHRDAHRNFPAGHELERPCERIDGWPPLRRNEAANRETG